MASQWPRKKGEEKVFSVVDSDHIVRKGNDKSWTFDRVYSPQENNRWVSWVYFSWSVILMSQGRVCRHNLRLWSDQQWWVECLNYSYGPFLMTCSQVKLTPCTAVGERRVSSTWPSTNSSTPWRRLQTESFWWWWVLLLSRDSNL